MKPVTTWIIYALKNPRTSEVRYIGWTSLKAKRRLQAHIHAAVTIGRVRGSHKNRWVLSLLSIGLQPEIEILESGAGPGWGEAERRWIAIFRQKGVNLLNRSDGGEGNPGYVFSDEARRKISEKNKGRKISPEHKAKWHAAARAANTGSHWTPERTKQQSDRLRGIPRPPHVIAAWHAKTKGRTVSAETRAKIAAARTGLKDSPETRAKKCESARLRCERERAAALAGFGTKHRKTLADKAPFGVFTCAHCKTELPVDCYYRNRSQAGGRHFSACIGCFLLRMYFGSFPVLIETTGELHLPSSVFRRFPKSKMAQVIYDRYWLPKLEHLIERAA